MQAYQIRMNLQQVFRMDSVKSARKFLGKWNSEIFSAITALTGTITGILITQKT